MARIETALGRGGGVPEAECPADRCLCYQGKDAVLVLEFATDDALVGAQLHAALRSEGLGKWDTCTPADPTPSTNLDLSLGDTIEKAIEIYGSPRERKRTAQGLTLVWGSKVATDQAFPVEVTVTVDGKRISAIRIYSGP